MKAKKYSSVGKFQSEIDLPDIFSSEVSLGAIYDAVKAENANMRSGNHSTKDRGEVRGGGKKPWSQKGTGRARQGSIRAPHWVGGGVAHGPKKRDYSISLSRNIKRKAVTSILAKKAKENKIHVLEDINSEKYSTKTVHAVFKNMNLHNAGKLSVVVSGENGFLKKSVRNIPFVKYVNAKRISCRDILYNQNLILTDGALKEISAQYKQV